MRLLDSQFFLIFKWVKKATIIMQNRQKKGLTSRKASSCSGWTGLSGDVTEQPHCRNRVSRVKARSRWLGFSQSRQRESRSCMCSPKSVHYTHTHTHTHTYSHVRNRSLHGVHTDHLKRIPTHEHSQRQLTDRHMGEVSRRKKKRLHLVLYNKKERKKRRTQ